MAVTSNSGSRKEIVALVASLVLAIVFMVSCISKIARNVDFQNDVKTWTMLGPSMQYAVFVGIPPLEALVAASLALWPRSQVPRVLCLVVLAAFSVSYVAQVFLFGRPNCGCLGLISAYVSSANAMPQVLLRNGILILLCIVGIMSAGKAARA